MRFVMAALAAATAGGVISAADPPATRVVRIDVIATDSVGRSVETLTTADFDLRENGAVQILNDVRFIRAGKETAGPPPAIESEADERTEAKRPDTRLVAIFLDDYHVSPASSARVRTAMLRFVDEYLAPNDLVFVMRPLDSLFKIRLTRDRDRSRQAILDFNGRQGDYTPRNDYERNFISGVPARIDQMRAQIAMSALNALALHMGHLDGDSRKTLIVVSEDLPQPFRRRGLEGLPTIDTIARSANRYNVSVYAVDPAESSLSAAASSPSTPAASRDETDSLRALAAATNGQFIVNVSDLAEGMRPIAFDSAGYYLLRYNTTNTDGKFHDVQVNVRKAGISLRTRKGYWAVPSDDELRAAALRPKPAVVPEPPRHISALIRPWFGDARGERGRTRVTFVWEPAGRLPGSKQPIAAHVVLKALATDGTVLYDGSVLPTGPLGSDVLDSTRLRADFDAPPGNLRLRMSIEDQTEQAIDSDVRDLSVRDLTGTVVLGTPAVFRGRTARDFRALASSSDAAPVSSREFSRTERLVIRFPVYAPANATLEVAATLMNRKGQAMRSLPLNAVPGQPNWSEIDLPLSPFAAGEYRIELVAQTPALNATDTLDFRITN
jgi:VWFA-related protein